MAKLNKDKPFHRIHGDDELGRMFMQVQEGKPLYFDSYFNEIVEGEEKKPIKRGRPPKTSDPVPNKPYAEVDTAKENQESGIEPSEVVEDIDEKFDVDQQLDLME